MEEKGEKRRRSSRVSAVEGKYYEGDDEEPVLEQLPRPKPEPGSSSKGRKKKKLRSVDELDARSKGKQIVTEEPEPEQGNQNLQQGNVPNNDGQLPAAQVATQMPEEKLLHLLIDVLRRKDQRGFFAAPVDVTEIPVYGEIIINPMDFTTLASKLMAGIYNSLEHFEGDMDLIFNNATLFNANNSVVYEKASKLHALARELLQDLRTDPDKFEKKYSPKQTQDPKKPRRNSPKQTQEPKKPRSKPKCKAKTPNRRAIQNVSAGTEEARRASIPEEAARCNQKPWDSFLPEEESIISEISNCSKALVMNNQGGGEYVESLRQFAEELGPTAKKIANQKVRQCKVPPPTSELPVSTDTVRIAPLSLSPLASRGETSHQRNVFDLPTGGLRDLNLPPDEGIECESFLSMMTNACKSDTKAPYEELGSKEKLIESFSRNNNNYTSSSLSFPTENIFGSTQSLDSSLSGAESRPLSIVEHDNGSSSLSEVSLPRLQREETQASRPSYMSALSPRTGAERLQLLDSSLSGMKSRPLSMVGRGNRSSPLPEFSPPRLQSVLEEAQVSHPSYMLALSSQTGSDRPQVMNSSLSGSASRPLSVAGHGNGNSTSPVFSLPRLQSVLEDTKVSHPGYMAALSSRRGTELLQVLNSSLSGKESCPLSMGGHGHASSSSMSEFNLPKLQSAPEETPELHPSYMSGLSSQPGVERLIETSLVPTSDGFFKSRIVSRPSFVANSSQEFSILGRNQVSSFDRPQLPSAGQNQNRLELSRLSNVKNSSSQTKVSSATPHPSRTQGLDTNAFDLFPTWNQANMQGVNSSSVLGGNNNQLTKALGGAGNKVEDWNKVREDFRRNASAEAARPLEVSPHTLWTTQAASSNGSYGFEPHGGAMINAWNRTGSGQGEGFRFGAGGSNVVQRQQSQLNGEQELQDDLPDVALKL